MKKSILIFFGITLLINMDSYGFSGRLAPYFVGESISYNKVEYTIKGRAVKLVTHINGTKRIIDSLLLSVENSLGSHIEDDLNLESNDSIWVYPFDECKEIGEFEGGRYPIIQENCTYIVSLKNINNGHDSLFICPYANYYLILPIENDRVKILCYKRYSIPILRNISFLYILRRVELRKIRIEKFERKVKRINNRIYKKKQKNASR